MKNTKQEILKTAKTLFNQYGLADITHRRIATEMGISHGNLNYHFKKREDLLEALYFEMAGAFDERVKNIEMVRINLRHIFDESLESMLRMAEYRFIWTDLSQLLRENSKIRAHFIAVRMKREMGYHFVFQKLMEDKVMRKEQFSEEYKHLINRLMNFSDSWLSSLDIYEIRVDREIINTQHAILFEMFYPYLTEKGLSEYKAIAKRR